MNSFSETRLISSPNLQVHRRLEVEGPKHDPYWLEELHINWRGKKVVAHEGLGKWLEVDGQRIEFRPDTSVDILDIALSGILPFTRKHIMKWAAKIDSRCSRCGGTDFKCEQGYPGETFQICTSCNKVHSSRFNIGAVI